MSQVIHVGYGNLVCQVLDGRPHSFDRVQAVQLIGQIEGLVKHLDRIGGYPDKVPYDPILVYKKLKDLFAKELADLTIREALNDQIKYLLARLLEFKNQFYRHRAVEQKLSDLGRPKLVRLIVDLSEELVATHSGRRDYAHRPRFRKGVRRTHADRPLEKLRKLILWIIDRNPRLGRQVLAVA